jgi:hypothetical protein
MTLYAITVQGCDGETRIEIELTPAQHALADRIADAICAASEYSCQPVMRIGQILDVDILDSLPGGASVEGHRWWVKDDDGSWLRGTLPRCASVTSAQLIATDGPIVYTTQEVTA